MSEDALGIGLHVFTGDPGTRDVPGLCELCKQPILDAIHIKHAIRQPRQIRPHARGRDVGLAVLQFTSGLLLSLGLSEKEIREAIDQAMKGARLIQQDGPIRSAWDDLIRLAGLEQERQDVHPANPS